MIYFYELAGYQKMLRYPARVNAFTEALAQVIHADSIVLELGTGFGYFALVAAKLGAKHVYAVEPNPIIRLARELASANQLSHKISFVEDYSSALSLAEKADICLSDLSGTLPYYESHIPTIVDARTRLLKAGGRLIPQKDRVFVAAVEAANYYQELQTEIGQGLDFSALNAYSLNQVYNYRPPYSALLTTGEVFSELDYASIESPSHAAQITFKIQRSGVMHGFCLWFERDLGGGIGYSTRPDAPEHTYSNLFLPLEKPLLVHENTELGLDLRLNFSRDKHYIYSWQTRYQNSFYQQSSFWGGLYQSAEIFRDKP